MKRNVTISIAAGLLVAAAAAQAENILVASQFESENTIVDSRGTLGVGGSGFEPMWREEYPFPVRYGTVED